MKKVKIFLVAIINLSCLTLVFAQNRSITFQQGTWAEVKQKAKAENKLIFLDAYTSWCGPCKWLAKNVFTNDSVADFYNSHFVCYSLDMEKGEGITIAAKCQIHEYPTLLYLTGDGLVVHRTAGSMPPAQFIAVGETALDPAKRLESWTDKYDSGNRDPAFIRDYLKKIDKAGLETSEIADWYFATQRNDELLTKENFEMIDLFVNSTDNPVFPYFFANRNKYIALVGNEKVENKMEALYNDRFEKCYTYVIDTATKTYRSVLKDTAAYTKEREAVKKSGYEKADELLADADINYYLEQQDWKKYADASIGYINKYKMNDYGYLNNYAWSFYQHIDDKDNLNQALAWAKKSIEIKSEYYNNDTYAALLYKLKKKKEAKKAAETAIDLGKKENADYATTEALLVKIKDMK